MRIAHHLTGSNTRNPLGGWTSILIVLLLIAPFTTLRAQETEGPMEVTAAGIEAGDDALVIELSTSRVAGVRTFSLTSPDRLVFDIEDAVLALDEDAEVEWLDPIPGVAVLTIEQFSTEPPVVRVAAETSDGELSTDRMAGPDSLKLAVFSGESPFAETSPGAPPEHMTPMVDAFWHEPVGQERDKFTIEFSFGVVLPQIRIESPTVLLLRFAGTDINLPQTDQNSYGTGVGGNIVERMRAERIASGPDTATEIRLTVPDTSALGYTLETASENSLELVLFEERQAEPEPPVETPEPAPVPIEGGQIMVLSTGEDVPTPPDARVQINRVQFQSVDRETDRFYLFYEGGELEPRVQRYNYPTRVALYFPDTAVVLPESAEGRFQSTVDGIVADELKVFNRVIEDVGPECQFIFYFPEIDPENVGLSLDYVDPGVLHIDFYHAASPLDIESPIEVNLSIDEGPPEPEVEEPAAEEEEPEVEVTPVEEETEAPAGEPETVTEEPAEEEPAESELPLIRVDVGESTDRMVNFTIMTSQPTPDPEWVEYRFPNRMGLVFPLSDVHLYEADPGVISSYTHVPIVPLVRAIIKDRPDEQHTIITFTLDDDLEKYTGDYERIEGGFRVTLNYNPLPEEPVEPAPAEPEAAPDTPESPSEAPQAAPPAEVTEPEVTEEEPPVEEPAEDVEEPEVETPGTPAAPGEPPFEAPGPSTLPRIDVMIGDVTDEAVMFNIATSEQLAMPEWVEYRYPDRLGLRFPLADVALLGEEVNTVQTHIDEIPILRAIVKDQPDDQHTTVTFTLAGALEEYENELTWNGTDMLVAFHRQPAAMTPEAPAVEEPEAPVPDQPVIAEVEVEAIPEEEAPVAEEPEPVEETEEVEEPVMIADGFEVGEAEETAEPSVVDVSFEAGEEYKDDFEGTLITDLRFEKMDGADVIRLVAESPLGDWEVTPINFPTKLLVRIPNARPVMQNGHVLRYDEQVGGNIVDQITANTTMSMGVTYTILTIYAHELESTSMLDYEVKKDGNKLSIAVFRAGGRSPLGMQPPEEEIEPRVMEREPEDSEPRAVRPIEEPVSEEDVDLDRLEGQAEPRLSLRLEDANIRDVLQLISEQANLNVSIGPSVRGTITISLTDVPLFELLDLLGAQMNFTYFVRSGVYIFGDPVQLQNQFSYWPRWYISLSYADPDQIRSILTALQVLANNQIQVYRGTLGGTGGITIASPVMILTGERADLERAYQIISAIDQPPVMIQVDFQILNTSITDSENFGFQFNFGTGSGQTNLYFSEQVSADPDMGPLPQGFDRLRLGTQNVYSINYVINYLLEEGYAELMNRSSLTVANNQAGQLFVGENIPYRSTFQVSELGRVTQRVATQSVGLTLNFRPHANPDGTVTMYLTPSNSNLLELTDVGPRTVDQRFSTTVRVKDSEPFIIGGFIRDEQRVNYDRFPFLSELPLLGHLFRNREIQNTRSELIFVFTPHIIRPTRHLPEIYTDELFEVPEFVYGSVD